MEKADLAPDEAHFFLAVCSQQPLYGSPAFVYLPSSANVLRERERHIGLLQEHLGILQGEVKKRDEWLEAARVELDKFEEVQERSRNTIAQLEQDNADKEKWAHELEQEIKDVQADRRKCIDLLDDAEGRVDDAEKRVIERTEWAWRLDRELEEARRESEEAGQDLAAIRASLAYRVSRRIGIMPERSAAPAGRDSGSAEGGGSKDA